MTLFVSCWPKQAWIWFWSCNQTCLLRCGWREAWQEPRCVIAFAKTVSLLASILLWWTSVILNVRSFGTAYPCLSLHQGLPSYRLLIVCLPQKWKMSVGLEVGLLFQVHLVIFHFELTNKWPGTPVFDHTAGSPGHLFQVAKKSKSKAKRRIARHTMQGTLNRDLSDFMPGHNDLWTLDLLRVLTLCQSNYQPELRWLHLIFIDVIQMLIPRGRICFTLQILRAKSSNIDGFSRVMISDIMTVCHDNWFIDSAHYDASRWFQERRGGGHLRL